MEIGDKGGKMGAGGRIDEEKWWRLLKEAIAGHAREDGDYATGMRGVFLHRRSTPERPMPHFMEPVLIIMLQGVKYVRIGAEDYRYGPKDCFLCTLDLPVLSCVHEAGSATPYLTMSVALNVEMLFSYAVKLKNTGRGEYPPTPAKYKITPNLLDALLRLSDLINNTSAIACMEEALLKEVHFHLAQDTSGAISRLLGPHDSSHGQIARIIAWIKDNFRAPFSIGELSSQFAISPSALYKNFKNATSLSPIQYQKMLRLCEGKQLLETGGHRVSEVAGYVGYESQTQFSREFKRLFGSPPKDWIAKERVRKAGVARLGRN